MNENKCPQCGSELIHEEGRKPKKFCSTKCRVKHFQKANPPKKVSFAAYQRLYDDNQEIMAKLADLQAKYNAATAQLFVLSQNKPNPAPQQESKPKPPKSKEKPVIEEKTGTRENAAANTSIQDQIFSLEEQKKGCGEGLWGKKMKDKLQKEINHLKGQLK